MIYTIRKNSNFLPAIAGIALMTITACGSASVSDFTKATQDAAIAAAVASARAEATDAATKAADDAVATQKRAVDSVRAELECTTPVCDNVVNTADLPSYPTTVTSNNSAFLTITGTQIDTARVTAGTIGGQRVAPTIGVLTRAGDDADGVRYFQGRFGDSGNASAFAGILPTTNLGAPLTAQPTTAAWPGSYSERGNPAVTLNFNIDFANRRIIAEHDISFNSLSFNLVFSDSGVISGAVLEHADGTDTRIVGSRAATGLIGTEGLVGVFINDFDLPDGLRYVGGFVAANPNP